MGERESAEAGWFKPCGACFGPEGCMTAMREATRDIVIQGGNPYFPDGTTPAMISALGRFARCLELKGLKPEYGREAVFSSANDSLYNPPPDTL